MKLAISNIAWLEEEEGVVAKELQDLGVSEVEIAPTKYWSNPMDATTKEIEERLEWWSRYGIKVSAFQSILFTRPDLKLFESPENRAECLEYLQEFMVLAGKMGAKRIVFGSPKNRQRGQMRYEDAFAVAKDFFVKIADAAEENGVVFCLEPNAPQYGCDFVTNAKEGIDLVRAVDRQGFGLHLDSACMFLAGDSPEDSIKESFDILQHFHISAPMLDRVYDREDIDYRSVVETLRGVGYDGTVSIEMRPGNVGENVARVKEAVEFMRQLGTIS